MEHSVSGFEKLTDNSCSTEALCRLCATKSQQTINVFDEELQPLDLISTINQCLQIKISSHDVLPKDVCLTCCEKLREYFEFYTLCSHSQRSLSQLYHTASVAAVEPAKTSNQKHLITVDLSDANDEEVPASILASPPKVSKRECRRKLTKPRKVVPVPGIEGKKTAVKCRAQRMELPLEVMLNENDDASEGIASAEPTEAVGTQAPISIKKILENYVWECTACSLPHTTVAALKAHYQKVHNQEADYKCMKCNKIYNRYRSFVRHVRLHNDLKRFACTTCGKKFAQKTILESHKTVHTEERPHVCPQCGKAFKQYSSLYLHSRSHLPEQAKPKFHCSVCKKMFSSKHTMENHVKIHTGEKNFPCDVCGKTFIAKGSLSYHLLSHDEAKNHTCSLCKKSFKTAGLLAKHSSLHTGIKPHQCDICGKQFRERSALKEHARIHTGEMPYVCEYCGKAFRFKGILTVHIRQHTGERPYKCKDCSRSFTNWANYNKHLKRRHNHPGIPASPPSPSFLSLDFDDPGDLPLSADALSIQDFVIDLDLLRMPSSYNGLSNSYYPHLPSLPP